MITLKNISKNFDGKVIFKNQTFEFPDAGLICISGVSGAGKTTLLNILSLIEQPDSGKVFIDGKEYKTHKEIQQIRKTFGYVFQNYGLVDEDTVYTNLDFIAKYRKIPRNQRNVCFTQALEKVGLDGSYLKNKIYQLSGGEQQRVALARLIVLQPRYIFADEPTGNLDEQNKQVVFNILKNFSDEGASVLYVSHDEELISRANCVLRLTK